MYIRSFEYWSFALDEETDDEPKKTEYRAEDLNDEHLNKPVDWSDSWSILCKAGANSQAWVRSVGQSGTAPIDTDRDTANHIAHPHRYAGPEEGVACILVGPRKDLTRFRDTAQLGRKDNRHDDSIDGNHFAEDN